MGTLQSAREHCLGCRSAKHGAGGGGVQGLPQPAHPTQLNTNQTILFGYYV